MRTPPEQALRNAASVLAGCERPAILAGQGARGAGQELAQISEILGAPIAKASLGKDCIPDDHPNVTGGIGVFGTRPTPERIGLRYPADVGDAKATLAAPIPARRAHREPRLSRAGAHGHPRLVGADGAARDADRAADEAAGGGVAALGLAVSGLSTMVLSIINVGILPKSDLPVARGLALAYGGVVQLLAGMWAFINNDTFAAVALSSYSGFWISFWALNQLRAPNGFGDELRTTLVSDGVAWGGLTLLRADDCGPFATTDVDLMASLSQCLAEGLRQAVLLAALRGARHADEGDAGLVLVADDDSVVMTDAAGQAWLRQIGSDVIAAVAGWARATDGDDARFARVRVRAATGTWLVVRGSALSGEGDARTAVTIEPAGAHDLAPLIVDAYGLTERERVITQLVAQGLSTKTIAGHLRISPWTVQDHLKSVFEKVGVRTRGELVSRVFLEHFAPRVAEPDGPGPAPPRGPAPALRGSADTTNGR